MCVLLLSTSTEMCVFKWIAVSTVRRKKEMESLFKKIETGAAAARVASETTEFV